jgi:putative transposase
MPSSLTNLLYHIVFGTKNREPLIVSSLRPKLNRYVGGIVRSEGGILLEIGGMPDHAHLVTKFKADASMAQMLRVIKSRSSKWVNEQGGMSSRFAWQTGYGAFSISQSQLAAVINYVQDQERHHRTMTFQEEYVKMLRKQGIEYDERYLWD